MISEPLRLLGPYQLEKNLVPTNDIYFDYYQVSLHKDETYREAALEIGKHFFRDHHIELLNARVHVMKPGIQLKKHTDSVPPSHENFHVLHLPLKTNDKAYLAFERLRVHLKEGHVYEINYGIPHWGANDGDEERIHLFIELFATPKDRI